MRQRGLLVMESVRQPLAASETNNRLIVKTLKDQNHINQD